MIRWAVLAHVVGLIRDAPQMSGVAVTTGFPGDRGLAREMVWSGEMTGQVSIPVGTGGRKVRDDIFEIPLYVRVAAAGDLDRTRLRCGELVTQIGDVLADDPTLGNFEAPGGFVVSAELTDVIDDAQETPSDGPLAFAALTLSVHSRLT